LQVQLFSPEIAMNKLIPHRKTRVRIHGWAQRFETFATLLLLAAVLISLTAATANVAGAVNEAPVGATTHPIQYWIGCAPSMVNNATLNYFKQEGFTAVVVVVQDNQTYQTQLNTIKSLNMLPIIDVEVLLPAISSHSKPPDGNTSRRKQAAAAISRTWGTTSRAM
jgi:hypothetical protein